MNCIYLNCGNECYCHASPMRPTEQVVWYKPTSDDQKTYCNNGENFVNCPRLKHFESYIRISHER